MRDFLAVWWPGGVCYQGTGFEGLGTELADSLLES